MLVTRQSPRTPDDVILQMTYAEARQLVNLLDAATVPAASLATGSVFITTEIAKTASTFYHAIRKAGVSL